MARRARLHGKALKEQRRWHRQVAARLRYGLLGVIAAFLGILMGIGAANSFAAVWVFPYRDLAEFQYVRATTQASDRGYGRYGGCAIVRLRLDRPPYTLAYGCSAPGARAMEQALANPPNDVEAWYEWTWWPLPGESAQIWQLRVNGTTVLPFEQVAAAQRERAPINVALGLVSVGGLVVLVVAILCIWCETRRRRPKAALKPTNTVRTGNPGGRR